jgi:2-polyprenyl-3-methyl-5-hydroxy-6-metoxy-1,4-benzoquinol methylase
MLSETCYNSPRVDVKLEKALLVGAQLIFHYELALEHLHTENNVLDMACGAGWGTRMLAGKARKVTGIDLAAADIFSDEPDALPANLEYKVGDVTHMPFADEIFDVITAFELLEHVDADACLREARRVLKPGGLFMLSTPQNSLGTIPINCQHLREYSFEELRTLCARYFTIEKVVGIKQGRIVILGDPLGQNTFMLCRKAG